MQNNESVQPLPDIFIGGEIISTRVDKYLTDKYPILKAAQQNISSGREETKSIWYTKDHIQTWLNEMDLMSADGMRVYFGSYSDESMAPGQLCLLMVLTRPSANGLSHEDIIYENEPGFMERQNAGVNSRSITENTFGSGENPKQFNYGSPCPPIC